MTILAMALAGDTGAQPRPLKSAPAAFAPAIAAGCRSLDVAPDDPVDATALRTCGLAQCKPHARSPIGLVTGHRPTDGA